MSVGRSRPQKVRSEEEAHQFYLNRSNSERKNNFRFSCFILDGNIIILLVGREEAILKRNKKKIFFKLPGDTIHKA